MDKTVLRIGQKDSFVKTITEYDVNAFAGLTGDFSRIHVDHEFAAGQRFGQPICHGLIPASYVSTVAGTKMPGSGCIFLDEYVVFKLPTFFGDTITAEVTLAESVEKDSCYIVRLEGQCINQRNEVVTTVITHHMLPKNIFVVES